jgi:hypothetical protein
MSQRCHVWKCCVLERQVKPELRLYIIDRIIFDDGNAELERYSCIFRQFPADSRIEWQEQPACLAGDRVAEIDPDVRARLEGNEPSIRQADIEGWPNLQIADVSPGRIAREAHVVSEYGLEVAGGINFP